MPTNSNYQDHEWVVKRLKEAQEADHDMREQSREAHEFVTHPQGQWESERWSESDNKPRYTFDLCDPIIDQVAGAMEQSDFAIRVSPAGGDSSEQTAETYDGLIRNIENISNAKSIYNRAGRNCVTGGLDGWRIVQKYVEGDSFDQDLIIEKIGNYTDRVWFGPHEEPDASDANYCWVLAGMEPDAYKERFPDANPASVAQDKQHQSFYHREDLVMVGEFLYLKEEEHEIVRMSDGAVYSSEELAPVIDELGAMGIVEEARRTRTKKVVYSRLFSADGWLTEPRRSVFENWLPVIPLYGNFKVYEDKVTYRGAVEKLKDPQRVFNYSLSREIEEGALAPREKYWMTHDQAEGHEEQLSTLNTNTDPVQFYNADPMAPGAPQKQGGAQINPGLRNISEAMRGIIGQTAGMFAANMGDNPGLQSGVAIEALQDRGDTGSNKFVEAREIAQRHTGRILVDAIPRIYGKGRIIRVIGEDGSQETVQLGQEIADRQTGQLITINDLSQGTYDVVCESGPNFKNRQNETVSTLTELGKVDPTVLELGGDIIATNVAAPGMKQLAERKRQQLFQAGLIPFDQMTDEEKQEYEAMQNQPPQESPEMVLARAEEAKAQADFAKVQQDAQESQQDFMLKQQAQQIELARLEVERAEVQIKAAVAGVEVKLKGAQAAKTLAEAEAQDSETQAFESGIMGVVESAGAA